MSGPFGPSEPGEGRNDPTQQWGGQQAPGGTPQWGGQPQTPASAQPTQQWGGEQQPPQQPWGQPPQQPAQQPWGQQPSPQWGQPGQQSQPQWGQAQPQDWQQGQPPQQQWGQQQPQWGGQQPAPQSGGKGKGLVIGLVVLGVVVIGAIIALVLLLTSKDKLDQSAVQDGVKKVLTDSYGIQDVSDVSCPSGQEVKVDATFDCSLKVSGEGKKVTIKITKDDGTYEVGRPN
ncbi:DUF4333 domain-containing protein [Nocardia sp. CA-128927]|uniref:DUF4333 domain-containing protein n=1 Tax=Nocardia sp. CA-128927 TaxID=3239975 RepID=UPI003D993DFD